MKKLNEVKLEQKHKEENELWGKYGIKDHSGKTAVLPILYVVLGIIGLLFLAWYTKHTTLFVGLASVVYAVGGIALLSSYNRRQIS